MGIGVNYIGGSGTRTFELDGAPSDGTPAAELLGAQHPSMPNFANLLGMGAPSPKMPAIPSMSDDADRGKVKLHEGDTPEVLSRKLAPNGSVIVCGNQIMLRGEEGGTPGGRCVYGSNNGVKGFFAFNQIDPPAGGMMLVGAGDTPDGGSLQINGRIGASIRVGGRTVMQIEITENGERWITAKEFYRMADVTPNGRIVNVSKEIENLILKYNLGGGNGKYGVRAFWQPSHDDPEKPHLDKLAFGADVDLDTWNEQKNRFDCNYDESDNLLPDPPVKIVETAGCAYNPNDGGEE